MKRTAAVVVGSLLVLGVAACDSAEESLAPPPVTSEPAGSPDAETTATESPVPSPTEAPAEWTVSLLEGFPEDVVPLFEADLIDTAYYSVRNDPQWVAVEGGLRNIHHAVYQTSAEPAAVLDHYLGLMSATTDADPSDGLVEGTLGKYVVWVNTTVESSYTAVYVQVDLPRDEVTEVNPFFADYPADLVAVPEEFVFFEDKYYEYLYHPTDMAFWRQFDVADRDDDDVLDLSLEEIYAFYEAGYGDRTEFTVDRDARRITWVDGRYHVNLAFYEGGGRGVLEIGWDWEP